MSDLVQKLRLKNYTPIEDVEDMIEQAADRIEALETVLGQVSRMRLFPDNRTNQATLTTAIEIARRALEGKHE